MNKKGQVVNLNTIQTFLVGFLILGLIAVALFAAFSAIKTSGLIQNQTAFGSFENETIELNSSGTIPATVQGRSSVSLTNVIVHNTSSGVIVTRADNYTISEGTFTNVTGSIFDLIDVNVSASFSYSNGSIVRERADLISVSGNITGATTSFFSNSTTLTTILFVVLLMGLLGLMVFVVKKFGGRSSQF